MDAEGVVDQIGPDTGTDLKVGARVMAIVVPNGSRGAYAEQVVVPAESVVRAPYGATDAQAATRPMNGVTARPALDTLGLPPARTVAITGAAGAVGGYAVQQAKGDAARLRPTLRGLSRVPNSRPKSFCCSSSPCCCTGRA